MVARLSTREFISRSKAKHGSRFCYTETIYTSIRSKVTVNCRKHGSFKVLPRRHIKMLNGGCNLCDKEKVVEKTTTPLSMTTSEFIAKCKKVYGTKYRYARCEYKGYRSKVTVTCKIHGDFVKAPHLLLSGSGCKHCKTNVPKDTEDFIRKAKQVHGNQYVYKRTKYSNTTKLVTITCKIHGDFTKAPRHHLKGVGCVKCYPPNVIRRTTKEFIALAKEKHGNKYSYKGVKYINSVKPVTLSCKQHGKFEVRPWDHLKGKGCALCNFDPRHSSIAINWIESEAKKRRLKGVQHARNGGEFQIPGTRKKVDGYHARTNTVFEFYGDCFHGNLKKYKPRSKPHPYSDKTAKQLYEETLAREKWLKSLGYTVVSIWESDYRRQIRTSSSTCGAKIT